MTTTLERMTPAELELIERSTLIITAEPEKFAKRFYSRLFKLAPDTRSLFPDDMEELRSKLVDELVFLTRAAQDLDSFEERASGLGERHRGYGVVTEHFDIVESVLLGTLGEAAGVAWTDELRDAWQALYRHIAAAMQGTVPTS